MPISIRSARLTVLDPEFEDLIPAAASPVVRCVELDAGPVPEIATPNGLGLLVVSGLAAQRHEVGDRVTRVLTWPGDLIPNGAGPDVAGLEALTPVRLAILDAAALQAICRHPAMMAELVQRIGALQVRTAATVALGQLPRVDERIRGLFGIVSEQIGRMTRDGIALTLPLTHNALGTFVGARRPTVSLALRDLAARGELVRRQDGTWLLSTGVPEDVRQKVS